MSSSSSFSTQSPGFEEPETRNWLDLPRDVTATILMKLGAIDILNNAQRVCSQWRSISNDPVLWRTIDMRTSSDPSNMRFDLDKMCRHAIDLSRGNLIDITLGYFGSVDLLKYITDSTIHLQRLRLLSCWGISEERMCEVAKKLPLLEELEISIGNLSKDALKAIGRCCPLLKSLKFNKQVYRYTLFKFDDEAFAIAQTMPNLCHLQLLGNKLTNDGVLAILDGCPRLESLDLRRCFNVNLGGSLRKRCCEQIKDFRNPNAPIDELDFDLEYESSDNDGYLSDIIFSDDEYDYCGFYGSDYGAYFGL